MHHYVVFWDQKWNGLYCQSSRDLGPKNREIFQGVQRYPHFPLLWGFCPHTRVQGLAGNALGLQSQGILSAPGLRLEVFISLPDPTRSPDLTLGPHLLLLLLLLCLIHWVLFDGSTRLEQTPYNQVDCLKSDSYYSRVPHFLARLQEKNLNGLKSFRSRLLTLEKSWGMSDARALPESSECLSQC